jgi:hypothetical protein
MGRFTVPEAARTLGITTDAVRMRLSRGTLRSEKVEGRVYVMLDDDLTGDVSGVVSSALVDELRAHNATLRGQLEAERQAHAEARRIIAGLVERLPPAIEAPRGEDSSPYEPREAPSEATATEEPERVEPRSWWRRVFGG